MAVSDWAIAVEQRTRVNRVEKSGRRCRCKNRTGAVMICTLSICGERGKSTANARLVSSCFGGLKVSACRKEIKTKRGDSSAAPSRLLTVSLEVELHRKLNQSWVSGGGNTTEVGGAN